MRQLLYSALCVLWPLVVIGVQNEYVTEFTAEVESCSWSADKRLCGQYDMDFVEMPSCGWGQYSVLCSKTTVATNTVNRNPRSLHIVSYNVRQIPPIYHRQCERERTCRIPEALFAALPTVDVITFQELFFKGCVEDEADMARLLAAYNFTYTYQPLEEPAFPGTVGAGVMIASRWPIIKGSGRVFKDKKTISSDFLSTKGVIYTAIQKEDMMYHVFTTHTQSGYGKDIDEIRTSQVQEIHEFKMEMKISSDEPVIYTGDFNADLYDDRGNTDALFDILQADIAKKVGSLNYTYDNSNPLVSDTDKNEWLDYIATSNTNLRPKSATMEAVNLRSAKSFEYCYSSPALLFYVAPWDTTCFKTASTDYLSDHYLLYGVVEF